MENLQTSFLSCWKNGISPGEDLFDLFFQELNKGAVRVASFEENTWVVHTWVKKAILLYFKHTTTRFYEGNPTPFYDKIPLKCATWKKADFQQAGFRMAPGAYVRDGAYIAPSAVLMPCFVNVGAYVGGGTMIDTMARVGSCAQVGARCHIAAGVGLGGVLEPPGALPVIIEDECFIGAQSQVVEGVRVGRGAILGMGTLIGASTKIIERETGKIHTGVVPPYAVVVPGHYASKNGLSLRCAVIIKYASSATRDKVALNDWLRDEDGKTPLAL